LSVEEWRLLMRLAMDVNLRTNRVPILKVLAQIGHLGQSPPFVELKTTIHHTACLQSTWPGEGWPTRSVLFLCRVRVVSCRVVSCRVVSCRVVSCALLTFRPSSYSILLWFYIDHVGSAERLDLVALKGVDSTSMNLSVALAEGKLVVQAAAAVTELPIGWQRKKWHHLALISSRKRFQVCVSCRVRVVPCACRVQLIHKLNDDQASDLHVYLDGNLLHTGKLGSAPRKLPAVSFTIGSASAGSGAHASSQQGGASTAAAAVAVAAEHEEPTSTPGWVWRAGQLWVLEDDLNETQIATSYCLGPGYKGTHTTRPTTRHGTTRHTVVNCFCQLLQWSARRVSAAAGVASAGDGVYQEGLGRADEPSRRRRRGRRWSWWRRRHRPQQQHHQRWQRAGPHVVERGS
jgi:hypothetical protein